jgi:hypothetical protein
MNTMKKKLGFFEEKVTYQNRKKPGKQEKITTAVSLKTQKSI